MFACVFHRLADVHGLKLDLLPAVPRQDMLESDDRALMRLWDIWALGEPVPSTQPHTEDMLGTTDRSSPYSHVCAISKQASAAVLQERTNVLVRILLESSVQANLTAIGHDESLLWTLVESCCQFNWELEYLQCSSLTWHSTTRVYYLTHLVFAISQYGLKLVPTTGITVRSSVCRQLNAWFADIVSLPDQRRIHANAEVTLEICICLALLEEEEKKKVLRQYVLQIFNLGLPPRVPRWKIDYHYTCFHYYALLCMGVLVAQE